MPRVFVNLERCEGCLTCTLACAAAHSQAGTIVGAMLEGAEPRIFIEAVKGRPVPVVCRHCEDPACVDACMTGAMQQDIITGLVTNEGHEQTCVGCWMCVMACPYGAITQQRSEQRLALKCDGCPGKSIPACVAACPEGALTFEEPETFAQHRRKQSARSLAEAG